MTTQTDLRTMSEDRMSERQNTNVDGSDQSPEPQPAGLDALLASREYQSPPPGISVTEDGQIVRDGSSTQMRSEAQPPAQQRVQQEAPTPTEAAPQTPAPEVTTQQPGMSEMERRSLEAQAARAAQLEDVARRQAQYIQAQALDNARREDAAFEADLNRRVDEGELDAKQAIALVRQREQSRLDRVQQWHDNQNRTRAQAEAENRVNMAKSAVISRIMVLEGIPGTYRPLLEQAAEPEQLEYTLSLIRPLLQQQAPVPQEQQAQQNVQAIRQELQETGVLNPAGDSAGAPPPEPPKQRSGDLVALLESREYQYGRAQ